MDVRQVNNKLDLLARLAYSHGTGEYFGHILLSDVRILTCNLSLVERS